MPLEGAAPRELMEDVREADWGPDGENLAIIHDVGGRDVLEFPIGTALHESAGYLSDVRVSPRGDQVAFMEHPSKFDDRGSVNVVDLEGKVRVLAGGYWGVEGMAWSPDGAAVYYSAGESHNTFSVYRAGLDGDVAPVSQGAGATTIHDIASDGTWAVTRDDLPSSIMFRAAGSDAEVDLSWLDSGLEPVLSADARDVAFTDASSLAGVNYAVTLRPAAGGAIIRLGEGTAAQFSADGKFVLAIVPSTPPRLMAYPVGAGKAVQFDRGEFENMSGALWLPGEDRILVSGNLTGQPSRCFLLVAATGETTPVGPPGIRDAFPSPRGSEFVARSQSGWSIYPLSDAGEGSPVASMVTKDYVIRWHPDGSALYVYQKTQIPAIVDRIEVATGRRETVLTLGERNRAGRVSITSVSMADDLHSVAYVARHYASVLYTVTREH